MSAIRLPSDQDASGRSFGPEELEALREVLDSGTLTATKGEFTKRFEAAVADLLGIEHVVACASGTAAVHVALAGLDLEPGDEVVTTAITDMGALSPILYQGAIPVFTDVDPDTMNVTAATIEASLSDRTRAIIVTHLFGNPCQMDEILALGAERGHPGDRGRRPGVPRPEQGPARRHDGRHRLLQLPAGQAHHLRRGRLRRHRRRRAGPPHAGVRQQGVALRRAEPRPRVPRPQLPDHRAAERRRCSPPSESSTPT